MSEYRALREVIEEPRAGYWGESDRSGAAAKAARVVRNGDAAGIRAIDTADLPLRWFTPGEIAKASLQLDDSVMVSSGEVGFASRVVSIDAKHPSLVSNFVRRIRAMNGNSPKWIAHLLQLQESKRIAERFSGGTAIHNLGGDFFRRYRVWVPPLEEQRRIAETLDAMDESINASRRSIAKLEQTLAGVLGRIFAKPEETHVALGDVCIGLPQYGCVAAAEKRLPGWPRYVRITDVTAEGSLRSDTEVGISPSVAQRALLSTGDLVFARSGATVGKCYLYDPADGPCAFGGYLIRFRPDPSVVFPQFVRWWTQSSSYWRWVRRTMREGAQPNINAQEYATAALPLPSIARQLDIINSLGEFEDALISERKYLDKLQLLRAGLSQDLLSGRVRAVVP